MGIAIAHELHRETRLGYSHSMLTARSWPPGAQWDVDCNDSYYVIVGNGISALTNHLTLLATPYGLARLGGRKILHIGGVDPWQHYVALGMGQWPALLALPEFGQQYSTLPNSEFLSAREFANTSKNEWLALAARRPFLALEGRAIRLESTNAGTRITVEKPSKAKKRLVAEYLDICGGPGPARRVRSPVLKDRALVREYSNNMGTAQNWPRVVTGDTFLNLAATPPPGSSIAVVGGGPTAAWCVERAQQAGYRVLWVVRQGLDSAFLSSRRNDGLAQGPLSRSRKDGALCVDPPLFPSCPHTRFAEGFEVSAITPSGRGFVDVQFGLYPAAGGKWRCVDWEWKSASAPLPVEEFAMVVLAMGSLTDTNEKGTWANLLAAILQPAVAAGRHRMLDAMGRVTGLQSIDGKVRLLGAAAFSHEEVLTEWRTAGSPSQVFYQSLVAQARVEGGVTLSGLLIAEANRYWDGSRINDNLNVNSAGDLARLRPEISPESARTWMEMRASRIPPFTKTELREVDQATDDRY